MTKVIAYTDSATECGCCGKTGLAGSYAVEVDGAEYYFGSTCAFKKHGADKYAGDRAFIQWRKKQKNPTA